MADDDEHIVKMLGRALRYEGYHVMTAINGHEAVQLVEQVLPDLIILDVMMPKMDGWEACQRIRASHPTLPIVMLTARDEVEHRVKGLDLGADDYVVKPFNLDELLARVRAHIRRHRYERGEATTLVYGDIVVNLESRKAWRGERLLALKGKEFDLLALFLAHPQQVLSKDQIIERVWDPLYDRESNVVEVYIAALRQKLEENNEKRVIETVRGLGYVLREGS